MARPPAYKLYRGDLATMHVGNDLQELVRIAKRHKGILGGSYKVKDAYGNVVWEREGDDE